MPKDRASEKSESAISEKTEDKVGIESSDSGKDSPEAAVITSEDGAVGNGAPEFVTGIRLHVIFFALLLCMFLVSRGFQRGSSVVLRSYFKLNLLGGSRHGSFFKFLSYRGLLLTT